MTDSNARFIFAGLCLLGLVAIWCGAAFEIRRQQTSPTISQRHFRWRMVSALLWTLILGSLAYGTLFSWPVAGSHLVADHVRARRFAAILVGSFSLMMIAGVLIVFDFYLTAQTRRIQNARIEQDLGEIARREIERAQAAHQQAKEEGGEKV